MHKIQIKIICLVKLLGIFPPSVEHYHATSIYLLTGFIYSLFEEQHIVIIIFIYNIIYYL